jgi:hypothetical protein
MGNFSGSDALMYAVGRPKADNIIGSVDIFKKNSRKSWLPLVLHVTIKGDKVCIEHFSSLTRFISVYSKLTTANNHLIDVIGWYLRNLGLCLVMS